MKRALDVALSALGLVILSPVMVAIAVQIKREDHGPILYSGRRVGRGGQSFRMHKFRTMVPDAHLLGGSSTADDDPRLTQIGRRLRKYKLDELPQLINVLNGEMSLVGPRPEVQEYVDLFTDEERAILSVRPGVTDWASLWDSDEGALLAGDPDPDRAYLELIRPTKIRLQLEYVRRRSMLTDLRLLLLTVSKLLRLKNIAVNSNASDITAISGGGPRQ